MKLSNSAGGSTLTLAMARDSYLSLLNSANFIMKDTHQTRGTKKYRKLMYNAFQYVISFIFRCENGFT